MVAWNVNRSERGKFLVRALMDLMIAKKCLDDEDNFTLYVEWIEDNGGEDRGALMSEKLTRDLLNGCNDLINKGFFE